MNLYHITHPGYVTAIMAEGLRLSHCNYLNETGFTAPASMYTPLLSRELDRDIKYIGRYVWMSAVPQVRCTSWHWDCEAAVIKVNPEGLEVYHWPDVARGLRKRNRSRLRIKTLHKSARKLGDKPENWYVSLQPIPASHLENLGGEG